MKAIEDYIKKHTKRCSNLAHYEDDNGNVWEENEPWLTPYHAECVAEIARKETIKEVCEWIKCNVGKYSWYDPIEDNEGFNVSGLIEDLKKAFERKP